MSDALTSEETISNAAARIAALRRVSGAEIVDEGIQLARQNYGALVLAALVPRLWFFAMYMWPSSLPRGIRAWPLTLFTWACASLADAAAARVAMDALEGRPVDPIHALRTAFRRAWPVVLSGLYRVTFGLFGFAVLIVPGLYVLSIYALIPALPALEPELGAWQALRRSATLTQGARLLAFGTSAVPYLFVFGVTWVLVALPARIMEPHLGVLFGGIMGASAALALIPFIAAIQVRLYVELRMRKEAIDIEWAVASLGAGTAA